MEVLYRQLIIVEQEQGSVSLVPWERKMQRRLAQSWDSSLDNVAILVAVATIHHNLGDRHVAAATEGKAVGEDQGACLTICNKEYSGARLYGPRM